MNAPATSRINRIIALDHAKGDVMSAWHEAIQSGEPDALEWIERNPHTFERAFIRHPVTPELCDAFLRHRYRIEPPATKPVLVCAMPKAGSTSFCALLAAVLGRRDAEGHNKNTGSHLGLDIDCLRKPLSAGAVIHSHLAPTPNVLALCKALRITPLIVMRNIFDALESRCRFERTTPVTVTFKTPADMESSVYRFAFDYLSFASQWLQISEMLRWPVFHFEDNVRDWRQTMARACAVIGEAPVNLDAALAEYGATVETAPASYRISGQPKQALPPHLVDFVLNLSRKFPAPSLDGLLAR